MFSPSQAGGPAMATRSRRRQRPTSSDHTLTQQPKAKRQRLPLTEHTFINPGVRPQAEMLEMHNDKLAKAAPRPRNFERTHAEPLPTPLREMSVRPKKAKQGERMSKGDGSVLLASTSAYSVSKLPALPDRIRSAAATTQQQGGLYPANGYAVSVTSTNAVVWFYNTTNPSPETFVFDLPYPSKRDTDPPPLVSLIPSAAAYDEPGLLVVMPVSGKITFWEHISNATTLDLLSQQRNGIEAAVTGLSHGETIVQLENIGPSGGVLALSSGRMVFISVRDSQGRSSLSVRSLASASSGTTRGSILGSIRYALTQVGYRGNIAAVRAVPGDQSGSSIAVCLTDLGAFQAWRLHRGGQNEHIAHNETRDATMTALSGVLPTIDAGWSLEFVDFAILPAIGEQVGTDEAPSNKSPSTDQDSSFHLLTLVSLSTRQQSQYALVETTLRPSSVEIGIIRTISSYSRPVRSRAGVRPRLYVPRSGLISFIVFDRAVVIASIAAHTNTPDSQLQLESNISSSAYEDVIDLRDEDGYEILGSAIEEPAGPLPESESSRGPRAKLKSSNAILMVRGVGILRVAVSDVERFSSLTPPMVSAKDKLEQAVFFGIKDDNPLAFDASWGPSFSHKELGAAAEALSNEILSSTAKYLSSLPPSMDLNLRQRSCYLERLMTFVNDQQISLDSDVLWALLFNAEKMEMAGRIWSLHSQFLEERADDDKKTIVSEIVEYIHEADKSNPNRSVGEVDRVRHWFIHDVATIETFLAWSYQMIKASHKSGLCDDAAMTRFVYEATSIMFKVEHDAAAFRASHLSFYRLSQHSIRDATSKPWTSSNLVINAFRRLVDICYKWLHDYYPPQFRSGGPDPGLVEAIRNSLPELTNQYLLCFHESIEVGEVGIELDMKNGQDLRSAINNERNSKILMLREFDLSDRALDIAQQHGALDALAELAVSQVIRRREEAHASKASDASQPVTYQKYEEAKLQLLSKLDAHGSELALIVYQLLLQQGGIELVAEIGRSDGRGYYTRFLRADQRLKQVAWINEVEGRDDMDKAAEMLLSLGAQSEQHIWETTIHLSLGKLALLADTHTTGGHHIDDSILLRSDFDKVDNCLGLISIQDHLHLLVSSVVANAVDEEAELMLAMQAFAPRDSRKTAIWRKVVEGGIKQLLKRQVMQPLDLIDLLSLANFQLPEDADTQWEPFLLALRVAHLGLKGSSQKRARKLIWRRLLNVDDWAYLNHTEEMDDDAVVQMLSHTQPYYTNFACAAYGRMSQQDVSEWILMPAEALFGEEEGRSGSDMPHDGLSAKMMEALASENASLRKNVERNQLAKWAAAARQIGERNARLQLDRLTEEAATTVVSGG